MSNALREIDLDLEFLNQCIPESRAANAAVFPDGAVIVSDMPDWLKEEIQKDLFIRAKMKAETDSGKEINEEINEEISEETGDAKPKPSRLEPKPSLLRDLFFLLIKIASIALAFILLFTLLFGITRYQDPSMAPAIKDGDLVIFYRYTQSGYQPQDAIALNKNGQIQVRRVIAVAGDTVDITEDGLVINGALQYEPEIHQKTERYEQGADFPLTVPEGQVFVLGDSREGATDSRVYGCVEISETSGKVMAVIRRRGI